MKKKETSHVLCIEKAMKIVLNRSFSSIEKIMSVVCCVYK